MTHGAYILARYSTDKQNPDSIEVQVEKCTAWCREQSLPVLDIFADFAVSGMKSSRPQYDRMMATLRSSDIADTVVIYDQSRMFRDMKEWFQFREDLEALGRRVVSVTQAFVGGDLSDPAVFANEGMWALFNQLHVLQTRQKVIAKMEHMARSGQFTGGRPYYGVTIKDGRRVLQEAEADVVRRIFREKAAGKSYRQISDDLAREGTLNRSNQPFGTVEIHDMLYREEYLGRLVYGKQKRTRAGRMTTAPEDRIVLENAVPAIVSQELWDAAHAAIKPRTGGPKYIRDYLLKGKVFCGLCGGAMTMCYSNNKRYAYYRCARKDRTHACDARQIKAETLEKVIFDATCALLGTPASRAKILQMARTHRDGIQHGSASRIPALQREIADTRKKLDNATNAVLAGLYSQAIKDKIQTLETQLASQEYRLQTLRAQQDAVDFDDAALESLMSQLFADPTHEAILSLVARVQVDPDTIKVWTILDITPPDPNNPKPKLTLPELDITDNCSARVTGINSYKYIVVMYQTKRPPQ